MQVLEVVEINISSSTYLIVTSFNPGTCSFLATLLLADLK
jgi:hypothetical protein